MEELVSYKTAILAKEVGFNWKVRTYYGHVCNPHIAYDKEDYSIPVDFNSDNNSANNSANYKDLISAPTQSLLQKFIRETRDVHIEIHRNASGYYWSMCKADGGTDLGWSDISGPNDGGVWSSFEDALENALQLQLSYDLPNDITIIKHWGNYVEFALKSK